MARELYLGLDVGTQGTKGVLVDAGTAAIVARASAAYGWIEGPPPGTAEQDPRTWLAAIESVVAALFRGRDPDRECLAGLAVSGQQHGCVLLDRDGTVLRPAKLWCDTSTADEARELSESLGRRIPAGFTASKVLWSARREPELWRRTAHVLLPHDFVNSVLTGVHSAECGDASGTGWFDPTAREYDARAMHAIDPLLADRVAPLAPSDAIVGRVTRAAARRFGLPEGLPVATGSGDNMLSALGSGACEPGVVVLSLGTSATIFWQALAPLVDVAGLVAPFCDATGAWLPLVCQMNATGVLEELRTAFAMEHEALSRLAADVAPGSGGVLFVPFLAGERVPDLPRASGVITGLRHGSFAPGVLYRAALEGISLNLASSVAHVRSLGVAFDRVRVAGGAARNELWISILADALDVEIVRLVETESAALGAALQAEWAVRRARGEAVGIAELARRYVHPAPGVVRPDAGRAAFYRDLRSSFEARVRREFAP